MPAKNGKVKAICFTLNNYTPEDVECLLARCYSSGTGSVLWSAERLDADVQYMCFGFERGATGTNHLQGYISFTYQIGWDKVRRELAGGRAHIERTKGNPRQASDYCKKDGNFWELGQIPEPGKRTDLLDVARSLQSGKRIYDVAMEFPATWIRNRRGILGWMDDARIGDKRQWKTEIRVYCGPTGSGKSRRAHDEGRTLYGEDLFSQPQSEWWDGYNGQAGVLMEDFYGGYPYHKLLTLLDRYPLQVPYKGGFTPFLGKTIWITSNKTPRNWYCREKFEKIWELLRRIDVLEWVDYDQTRPCTYGDDAQGACAICGENRNCKCPTIYGANVTPQRNV